MMKINRSILIWVGGKFRLLNRLGNKDLFPPTIENYYEPFVGGATLAINVEANQKYLSDFNVDLINLYKRLKNSPEAIIRNLAAIKSKKLYNTPEGYFKLRELFNSLKKVNPCSLQCASLFLYLNAKGFQGLCRYNKSGGYNVPPHNPAFEKRKFPDTVEILEFSKLLKDCNFYQDDFRYLREVEFEKDDLVVLDPPYIPISTTSNFTNYTGSEFSEQDHIDVKLLMDDLTSQGVRCMAFNGDSEATHSLYAAYHRYRVPLTRILGSKKTVMGTKLFEVIITNYNEKYEVGK